MTRLSPLGRAVLNACAISPLRLEQGGADSEHSGCTYVSALLHLIPAQRAVARASLSRTLRRLWRAGWVELIHRNGSSLTAWHAAVATDLQIAERDPDQAFGRGARAAFFPFVTPEEYLDDLRWHAARRTRGWPAHVVQITSLGRQRLTA